MFEISVAVLFLLALCAALILLPILVVLKAAQLLFERPLNEVVSTVNEVRDYHWRNADAVERERMVRKACGWRVIGRVVGAGALVSGAFVATSSTIGFACCLAAWRMLKPIKQEMRDACAYRSTGAEDDPALDLCVLRSPSSTRDRQRSSLRLRFCRVTFQILLECVSILDGNLLPLPSHKHTHHTNPRDYSFQPC